MKVNEIAVNDGFQTNWTCEAMLGSQYVCLVDGVLTFFDGQAPAPWVPTVDQLAADWKLFE